MGSYGTTAPAAAASNAAHAELLDSTDEGSSSGNGAHHRFASYASGASTPDWHSDDNDSHHSTASAPTVTDVNAVHNRRASNPKMLSKSSSAIGLDEMIEDRRADGDLRQNVVHIEVPFGKPIEEVYEGVHTGPVLGSGISGLVRLVTHKATGLKYAVKVLDLGLVDTSEGLRQLREEIFIMCQLYVCLFLFLFVYGGCLWNSRQHLTFVLLLLLLQGPPQHCAVGGSLRESVGDLSGAGTLSGRRTL